MELKEAINILERYNRWRRGADIQMENTKDIGIAIDTVINYFKDKSLISSSFYFLLFNTYLTSNRTTSPFSLVFFKSITL